MKRNIFIGLLVVLIIILFSIVYIYNKPHRDVVDEKPSFSLDLEQMHDEFSSNEATANEKYFNQVVELTGRLNSLKENNEGKYTFVLESNGRIANGEIAELTETQKGLIGKKVKVKGLFIGYDDLLEEIQLSECTINEL